MESVSCSLLKLLCLSPDLESSYAQTGNLNKLEGYGIEEEGGYSFTDINRIVSLETNSRENARTS